MAKKFIFTKSHWADGRPSIEIDPYSHSRAGFQNVLQLLEAVLKAEARNVGEGGLTAIPELVQYTAEFDVRGTSVVIQMDEVSCSVAFGSEVLLDQTLAVLREI